MTEREKWEAVRRNDAGCDGLFFYAVKTTGIYCRPSCRSKLPRRENLLFFDTAEEARAAGFRPCKRCRSDLADYQPMRETAAQLRRRIDRASGRQAELHGGVREAGLTPRRLTDVFKSEYGVTPRAYADSLRLREAKRLLSATEDRVVDIAYASGFSSLSAFHRFFKRETALTPTAYRRAERGRADAPASSAKVK